MLKGACRPRAIQSSIPILCAAGIALLCLLPSGRNGLAQQQTPNATVVLAKCQQCHGETRRCRT